MLSIELFEYREIVPSRPTKYIAFSFSRDAASTGWSSVAIFVNDNSEDEVSIELFGTTAEEPHDASEVAAMTHAVASVKVRQFFICIVNVSVVPAA